MLIVFLLIACQAVFYTTQNFMSMDGTELCVYHLTPIINQENLTDLPTANLIEESTPLRSHLPR